MNLLNLVMFSVSMALIGAASYNATFETSYVCSSSVTGSSIGYYGNVASSIVCGMMCANRLNCESFLLFSANSTCFLRDDLLTDETACENNVLYGKKFSVETNPNCTEPVGKVRLCNGGENGTANATKGRVEVFIGNQWGSICDDGWGYSDSINARVVCKMFGFTDGVAHVRAAFGESSGPIWLDNVECSGDETSILNCVSRGVGIHSCSHYEDVGVSCF